MQALSVTPLCHSVQSQILTSTFISTLPLDLCISSLHKKMQTVNYYSLAECKYSKWDWAPSLAPPLDLIFLKDSLCLNVRSWVSLRSSNYWPDLKLLSQWEPSNGFQRTLDQDFLHIKSSDALRHPLHFALDTDIWKGHSERTFELMIKRKQS